MFYKLKKWRGNNSIEKFLFLCPFLIIFFYLKLYIKKKRKKSREEEGGVKEREIEIERVGVVDGMK